MKRSVAPLSSRLVAAALVAVGALLFGIRPAASAPDAAPPPSAQCGRLVHAHRFVPRVVANWAALLEYRGGARGKSNGAAQSALCMPAKRGACNSSHCSKNGSLLWRADGESDLVFERKDGKLALFPKVARDDSLSESDSAPGCQEESSTLDVLATTPLLHVRAVFRVATCPRVGCMTANRTLHMALEPDTFDRRLAVWLPHDDALQSEISVTLEGSAFHLRGPDCDAVVSPEDP
jgi:hypothetical protein